MSVWTTPQKFGCVVFYDSNPHENFTEINLISAKLTSGAALYAYKRSASLGRCGLVPDFTEGDYSAPPDSLAGGRGRTPPQEPHTARLFGLRHFRGPHNIVGFGPMLYYITRSHYR